MELSHRDVLEIIELLRAAHLEYFELEVNGTKIVASSGASTPPGASVAKSSPEGPSGRADVREDQARLVIVGEEPLTAASDSDRDADERPPVASEMQAAATPKHENDVVVTAPVVGLFYVAPEPGADPYVTLGDHVEIGDTIGLVEVMKVFNSVTSDISGEVVEILAKNEEFVEFAQPLFRLRPVAEK